MSQLSVASTYAAVLEGPAKQLRAAGPGALQAILESPAGPHVREQIADAIVDQFVPVDFIVPECYREWRAPVREAMRFVVCSLSASRLAPKVIEQLEMPANTPPEERLLGLIAKVPGLQKLGQVIARNRRLRPALRRALMRLENGIRETSREEVCASIRQQLGDKMAAYDIAIDPKILSEASVSTVIRFTWRDESGERQSGVLKVLKAHVPGYFQEDMQMLEDLARHFARRHRQYGRLARILPDTFAKVRRLLQHEIDFPGEQAALRDACEFYRRIPNVSVPTLIAPLCTPTVTAMSEARGSKVVDAAKRLPARSRARIADLLVEAMVVVPLLSSREHAVFHADPHAGNLLYDSAKHELTIVDWALKEELTSVQRRRLALLMCSVAVRDKAGAIEQVKRLSEHRIERGSVRCRVIHEQVTRFIDDLAIATVAGPLHAMKLLESCALEGVRFPASLIMFSKMLFTLQDVIADVSVRRASFAYIVGRHLLTQMLTDRKAVSLPMRTRDYLSIQCGSALYAARLGLHLEQSLLDLLLQSRSPAVGPQG